MLILIRGLPGSGKSTLASSIVARNSGNIRHYEADMYFMQDGKYVFDPRNLKEAHNWCRRMAFASMEEGATTVVSNTFTQKWEMAPYIDHANRLNIPVIIHTCTGNYKSVHNVPEDAIQRMKERWEA